MAATIRTWSTEMPVRLAGTATGSVASPPRLVTNPWAEASRTCTSMMLSMASSTEPPCFCRCLAAAVFAPGSRP